MRAIAVSALAGVLLIGGCTKAKPQPAPNPPGKSGVIMKVVASKAEYAAGEPIVLKVELSNGEGAQCRVSRVPEGAVSFVSLTQDGNAVVPGFGEASYIDGMSSHLRKNLVQLAPGAAVAMELRSDRESAMDNDFVLETSTLDALDTAALTYWPVVAPGKYTLSARYILQPFPDAPADLCRASGDPVTATFTVLGG